MLQRSHRPGMPGIWKANLKYLSSTGSFLRQHPPQDGMREVVETGEAPAAVGPYSQAIVTEDRVYTAGQIGLTPDGEMVAGGVADEARQCLENLSAVLEAAGSGVEDAVKVTVFLADMEDYGAVNAVYSEFFPGDAPARSAVEVARLPKDARVEMEAVAVRDA